VDVVGKSKRRNEFGEYEPDAPLRPAFATGRIQLSIPPSVRELAVVVDPAEAQLSPGGETNVQITVLDHARQTPVTNGEVALLVVDESMLALTYVL
jgi:hypothetical protein